MTEHMLKKNSSRRIHEVEVWGWFYRMGGNSCTIVKDMCIQCNYDSGDSRILLSAFLQSDKEVIQVKTLRQTIAEGIWLFIT